MYAGAAGCGARGWTLAPSPGHRKAPRPGEDERHPRAWQAKDPIWTWRNAKATRKVINRPAHSTSQLSGAQPQAPRPPRPRASGQTPESRGHVRWDLGHAPRRHSAPGGRHCACAPWRPRGGASLSGGRGGAAPRFRGLKRVSVGRRLRAASVVNWAPSSGRWGSPVVGGALWRIWGGGRKRILLNWMTLGVRDVWTGRSRQNGFKGKVRWFLLKEMLCEHCFSIVIILNRFVNLLLCHGKEARSLPLPNPANG